MDKSLVTKATSPDEVPTPGYMFNEIARITHASADASKQLIDFLLKRLKKDNVHVKIKVLRVIKHCCMQGHATFRRDMQRHTTEIKECLGARSCERGFCAHGALCLASSRLTMRVTSRRRLPRRRRSSTRRRPQQECAGHGAGVHDRHL